MSNNIQIAYVHKMQLNEEDFIIFVVVINLR